MSDTDWIRHLAQRGAITGAEAARLHILAKMAEIKNDATALTKVIVDKANKAGK